jgi:hypothetical protein
VRYVQVIEVAPTSIQVDEETRERLARLKASPRETYDELLRKLLALIPEGDDEGPYTDAFRIGLLDARLEIKTGRTLAHEDVKRRLGL